MGIMELGALGELVGGVAVIVSLVFVGLQVRYSTKAQNASTADAAVDRIIAINNNIAGDGELARIMSEGSSDRASFERPEYLRFHLTMQSVFMQYDSIRVKRDSGMVHDSLWQTRQAVLHELLSQRGIVQWWDRNARTFSAEFQGFIEGMRSEATS